MRKLVLTTPQVLTFSADDNLKTKRVFLGLRLDLVIPQVRNLSTTRHACIDCEAG